MNPRTRLPIGHHRSVMTRILKLLVPLAVLVVVGIYLADSFAGASENDPPPREPVVLPSQSGSPSAPPSSSPGSSTSTDPSGVPVVTPDPVDDDDDDGDDDDHDDLDDND
ncbi:hypothetical protein J2S40_002424 [Nocardioides luteus]|uniref:Small secreted hydrophilic protein n=2 Tax=Nocardioides luteus TaxID=1844 RepID=A0ABQ5SV87_9ACTN|nr:hypothetical protein [Nocardioides luteus]GGR65430.1 hypothetical protein GCM10010197_36200 [Nocardioides luteus]GLJ66871.1 hypothetical protein GCM10017579_09070 [Nocardioides luteus]